MHDNSMRYVRISIGSASSICTATVPEISQHTGDQYRAWHSECVRRVPLSQYQIRYFECAVW
eukprot:1885595-Rhodomonas_salina.2